MPRETRAGHERNACKNYVFRSKQKRSAEEREEQEPRKKALITAGSGKLKQ